MASGEQRLERDDQHRARGLLSLGRRGVGFRVNPYMKRAVVAGLTLTAALLVLLVMSGAIAYYPTVRAQGRPTTSVQAPTFRTGVEYVEVDARVVDAKSNPVRNLIKEDFRVFEDGKEQTIEGFSTIDIPVESTTTMTTTTEVAVAAASAARVEPDVSINHFKAEVTKRCC